MGFNPLDSAACGRQAGSGAVLPPPFEKVRQHATPSSKMRSQQPSSSKPKAAPTAEQLRAISAALKTNCNVVPQAFVVAGLDVKGNPFVFASDKFEQSNDTFARSDAWRRLRSLVEPELPAPFAKPPPTPAAAANAATFVAEEEPVSKEWVEDASTEASDESRRASLVTPARKPKTKVKVKSPKSDTPRARKRQRSTSRNLSVPDEEDDDKEDWSVSADIEPEETPTDRFQISDQNKVIANLGLRLDQMQQLACKVILKAWIKAIEPKKQSNFPYVGSDDTKPRDNGKTFKNPQAKRAKPREGPDKPDWWPKEPQSWWALLPNQKCKELEKVRHKEPDHLKKEDRLVLGVHILLYQAKRDGGIDLLIHSTKDCVLQFDQDNDNATERRAKRDRFLQDIYDLAQQWSDFILGGLDADAMHVIRQYPKQALSNKKRRQNSTPKRVRQTSSSTESQEAQPAALPMQNNEVDDLSLSTKQLELQNSSPWTMPNGLPDTAQVNEYFQGESSTFQFGQLRNLSDPTNLQPAYPQNPMMPPQVYDEVQIPSRFAYDTKNVTGFPGNSGYEMSREPSYVSQPSTYNNEWRAVQSNPSFSPSSTTSLAQSSNTSYASPATTFPGRVDYSFSSVNPLPSPQAYQSSGSQVGGLSAASPCMPQIVSATNIQPMMQGMRGQASYDEQYTHQPFRTGSLGHPHIPYNMNNTQFG